LSGTVDFGDFSAFFAVLFSGEYQVEADVDENGTVNFGDISNLFDIIFGL